jgi:hypothetical protein
VATGIRSWTGLIDYWIEDCIATLQRHAMEMEQTVQHTMERLLDEMKALLKADHDKMMAKMKASHEEMMATMGADRGGTNAYPE